MKNFWIVILVGLGVSGAAVAQSPWTQKKGGGFAQLALYSIGPYDRLYLADGGEFRTSREITETTLEAYAEYGISDRVTFIGVAPFRFADAGDPVADPTLPLTIDSGSLSAAGNLSAGGRFRFVDRAVLFSGQFDVEFPTGTQDEATGLSTGYDAFTFAPSVSVGKGFGSRAYAFGYAGVGYRTNDFSSDWRIGAEGGVKFFGRLWLVGLVKVVKSFENGDVVLPLSNLQTGLFVNDQEYTALGLKGLVDITQRIGLQLTYFTAVDGNFVPKSPLIGFGVYGRW